MALGKACPFAGSLDRLAADSTDSGRNASRIVTRTGERVRKCQNIKR